MIVNTEYDGWDKMIDVIDEFGLNAGRVWQALHNCGPLNEIQLIEETCLREHEVFAAVGWLARENKIRKDNDVYQLDQTNLTFEIGNNAGEIWNLLYHNEELDTYNISKMINKDERNIFYALGWLARENKIHLKKKNLI